MPRGQPTSVERRLLTKADAQTFAWDGGFVPLFASSSRQCVVGTRSLLVIVIEAVNVVGRAILASNAELDRPDARSDGEQRQFELCAAAISRGQSMKPTFRFAR